MAQSYRTSHSAPDYGLYYRKTVEQGFTLALWNDVEGPLLRRSLEPLAGPGRTCLDFACGTGRITRAAAAVFERVEGVDISASMLAAAEVPANVVLTQADLTSQPLGRRFDVATAFRFFLNAEDTLRRDVLKALHGHLRDGGHLVCNIHMNATSPGGLLTSLLAAVKQDRKRKAMSRSAFVALLEDCGFTPEKIVPYCYLPYVTGPWSHSGRSALASRIVGPVEGIARAMHLPAALAQSFLVVARRV